MLTVPAGIVSIPPLVPRHVVAALVHEVYEHTGTTDDEQTGLYVVPV